MPKIVDKKAKAKAISEAALQVFTEKGFHEARMTDIAKTAKMGKGTIYDYFSDKADILQFIFDDYFAGFSEALLEAIEGIESPAEKLIAFIDFALVSAEKWEDQCAAYINCFSSPKSRETLFSLSVIYDPVKKIIADIVRDAQAHDEIYKDFVPEVVAQLLVSIYDGIILHRMLQGRSMDRKVLHKAVSLILKKGLLKKTDPETTV